MNKRLCAFLTLICMIFSLGTIPFKITTVYAETTNVASGSCGVNATWVLDSEGTLSIGGSGDMTNYTAWSPGYSPFYIYRDKIKSVILENGITRVGNAVFYGCSSLTSISLPDGLTSIGESAFKNCTNLLDIDFPDSLKSIGSATFYGCSSITSINLPNGVTSIGYLAFSGCSSLISINLPTSITKIEHDVFYDCISLKSIILPDGVTNIGYQAFLNCSSLASIILPSGLTNISDNAFYGCSSLTSIILPDGVTSIGNAAFFNCSSLASIILPDGLIGIGGAAFHNCVSLTSIILPNKVTEIEGGTFSGCTNLKNIILPNGVTSIGNSAFYDCRTLISVGLPEGVVSIGDSAFSNCSNLTSIILPESATSIGSYAFNKCDLLKFRVVSNTYAYWYVMSNRYNFSYLLQSEIKYPIESYMIFRDDYLYLKLYDIRSLSSLLNYSPDIPFQDIVFSISDVSTAMISDGNIAGIGEGSSIVTASYGNFSSSFTLVISVSDNEASATGISLNEDTLTINKGLKTAVKPTITPVTATDRIVTWSSSDTSILIVENGVVTAVAPGTAIVTASINGYSDTIAVTVKAPLLALAVDNDDFIVNRNETHKIYSYHYPYDTTDDKTVTYTSSDESVAMVDSMGIVTGIVPGITTILLSNGFIQKSVKVTVTSRMTGISLNKTTFNGIKNSSERLSVNFNPVDTTDDKTISWFSGNTSIATVDSSGLVTLVSKGITTITATVGSYSAICTIIVTDIPLKSISLNATELSLTYGEKSSLAVTYAPSNTTDDKTVNWTSNDESIAIVSTDGIVTAVGNGTAIITATTAIGNKTASCIVIAVVPVTGVSLDKNILNFTEHGQTESLVAAIIPSNAANKTVTWTSSDDLVATVSTDGIVTAVGNGTATITVTIADGNHIATCEVTVAVPVNGVALDKIILNFTEFGQNDKLVATIAPSNAANKALTWTSSDELVAMVSEDGTVTAIGNGIATITAATADGNQTTTCTVNVAVPVIGVMLDKSELSFIEFGLSDRLTATISPSSAANQTLNWSSSNEMVATVIEDGTVTAVGNGTTTITVATVDGNQTATCVVIVEVHVTEVTLDRIELSFMETGLSERLVATITPLNAANQNLTWTSSDELVAIVGTDGTVTAVGIGTTTITATTDDGNKTATCIVTLKSPVNNVVLDRNGLSFREIGQTDKLVATIQPSEATNKNTTWKSSNETVATVSEDGTITAVGNGTAMITVTTVEGNKTATCMVTVMIPVNNVVLDRNGLSFTQIGQIDKLVATIEPSDAKNKNITWKSNNETVATVSTDGTVTTIGNGTASITVTTEDGNKTATCMVTVGKLVTGVTLNTAATTINGIGVMEKLVGTIAPSNATNQKIIWSSSNTGVATVDTAGKVTSKGYGTAVITATTEDGEKAATCTVTVKAQKNYSGIYNIKSIKSGLVMDVNGGGKTEGTNIIQWTANGGLNQQWKFETLGNGYYKITSVLNPAYSLDVNGGGAANGTRVIQWTYHGGINQQWKIIENVDGSISLMSRLSTESGTRSVLDVNGGGTRAGVNVIQWTSNGLDNQKWTLVPVAEDYSGVYTIKSKKSGLVMDVNGGGKIEGTNIIQWSANGGLNQQWKFESLGNGYYKITSVLNPTYSLDVNGGGTAIGTKVIQWTYRGATNQQWKIIKNADGSVSFMSRQSVENGTKYVLDVNGGGTTPGVNVIQWTSNGGDNQKWYLEIVN